MVILAEMILAEGDTVAVGVGTIEVLRDHVVLDRTGSEFLVLE